MINIEEKTMTTKAKTKTVSLRIDEELYGSFVEFCEEVYIPPSALFSAFAAKTVREQRIPFEVATDPFYSKNNQERLNESIRKAEAGHLLSYEPIDV